MDKRKIISSLLYSTLIFNTLNCAPNTQTQSKKKIDAQENCFNIDSHKTIGLKEINTTPEQFLSQNPDTESAINGIYFDKKGQLEGIVYLADNHFYGTRKNEHIRGYFSVNKNGSEVKFSESLDGKVENYWMVIGTHPLLVTKGTVNSQAMEERYNSADGYRSAIATKDGKEICFVTSEETMKMGDWAQLLQKSGYYGAINLDGGPLSQMAVREGGIVKTKGHGNQKSRLIIFSYKK